MRFLNKLLRRLRTLGTEDALAARATDITPEKSIWKREARATLRAVDLNRHYSKAPDRKGTSGEAQDRQVLFFLVQ